MRKTGSPGLHRLRKLGSLASAATADDCYKALISQWRHPEEVVIGGYEPSTLHTEQQSWPQVSDVPRRSMFLDTVTYLPDDILTKLDRASMAVSLEARVPLLDHRVVEFVWRLPLDIRVGPPPGKKLLRQLLARYVPPSLTDRPKMGFGVPIGEWLRGPLEEWAHSLLDEQRLRHDGFFQPQPVQQMWREHLSGRYNWQHALWNVLMFQCWLDRWGGV